MLLPISHAGAVCVARVTPDAIVLCVDAPGFGAEIVLTPEALLELLDRARALAPRYESCSWCHEFNRCVPGEARHCARCLHRADLPRAACDCGRCRSAPPPVTAQDLEEAARWLENRGRWR